MNAPTELDKTAEFTRVWKTLGVEDRSVEVDQTVTMRPPTEALEVDRQRSLPRLPALLEESGRTTLPEIRFKNVLGEGGMGLVSLATQVPLGRDVAVKGLRESMRSDEMRLALLREGWTTGVLEHPNIVPVYTLGRDGDDEPLIVMKRIEGVNWLELMRDPSKAPREFDSSRPLDWHIDILAQVCNAVHYAHSKAIIHRDLKPENVMIGEFGEVYVLDWGIAVTLADDPEGRLPSASAVTSPAGTPAYMAPEMVDGDGSKLSTRTDVYLLGALLHEILVGRPPHSGETLYEIMFEAYRSQPHDYDDSVPAPLADICHKAMAADPDDRFESAEVFRQALIDYKRHSEALRLAEEAQQRLAQLRRMLASDEDTSNEAQIYKLFGECRFGYEQALRVEPDTELAREGLQDVLETMAARELDRGAYQAASLIIADFPQPRPAFDRRLAELEEQLESREQEFEDLQKIKHEVDPNVGRASRSRLVLILGIVWAFVATAVALAVDIGNVEMTHPRSIFHEAAILLLLLVALYIARREVLQNAANRRMMHSLAALFAGGIIFRVVGWMIDIEVLEVLTLELVYFGIGGTILALTLDRRILWGAIPYLVSAPLTAMFPDQLIYIFAATNFIAMTLLAWRLWPRALRRCEEKRA